MMTSECVSLICAVLSLCSAILIGILQIRQNSRVNRLTLKRHDNTLYSEATKFILKYSSSGYDSEILLLPLCVMAYKYNPIYPYSREMYREFCILSEDLQELILKRCSVRISTGRCDKFFDRQIEILKLVIQMDYPGDFDIFYDNAKYFERALTHHGSKSKLEITCAVDKYQQADYDCQAWVGYKPSEMSYDSHITNLLAYEKLEHPIKRLVSELTSMGCPDASCEMLTSYLCCEVAKYVACYSCEADNNYIIDAGNVCDFSGKLTMEDFFLDALLNVYCYIGH